MMKIAVVGQGVIGSSAALAILQKFPESAVTLFGDRPFEKTCSYGPAGLFRLDRFEDKHWAKMSFERFAEIERQHGGDETGIKLISGHIQSDNEQTLKQQEKNYGDIVYNFRWLTDREMQMLFPEPSKHCIHYTAYAAEGKRYVPWLRRQAEALGAQYVTKSINSLTSVADDADFDVVINSAGLEAGKLAGDDDTVRPIKGVGILVDAPWHKHFNYRDFSTFTIPMTDGVLVGTVRQPGRVDLDITDEDRKEIWDGYLKLQPNFKNVKVLGEWSGIRPDRPTLRLEHKMQKNKNGKDYLLIHNYGHGGNGFTLGWGCALDVVKFIEQSAKAAKSKL